MNRQDVEKTITEYLKPIYGFALKRCGNLHDAEDLSQEIVAKAFRTLLARDDIADMGKFIWTVAHNTLSNFYRDHSKNWIGIPLDDVAERIADPRSEPETQATAEAVAHLRSEIAYLSKLQRRIVIAYYFENQKQSDIAQELGIPVGTVKWHLFEAKKELKRGMNTMRNPSDLKFNPITFACITLSGSVGEENVKKIFRSMLTQNICYCVRNTAKTIHQIADDLGVSPVYVESEVDILEEYGFLLQCKDKYIANFLIEEPTAELLTMEDTMCRQAAEPFANELFDTLYDSGILDDPAIICGQTDEPITLTGSTEKDQNFLMWTLIPYIITHSGMELLENPISREEVMALRPDGAKNLLFAIVETGLLKLPGDFVTHNNYCGPMDVCTDYFHLWRLDTQWSAHRIHGVQQDIEEARRVLDLYGKEEQMCLCKEEYAWLCERGYVKTCGEYGGMLKSSWQVVVVDGHEMHAKLMEIGRSVREKYMAQFNTLKAPYVAAVLETVPEHLRKAKAFDLQFTLFSDPHFLLHCITALLKNGKLKEPTEGQKQALSTLITNR